jgi:hypothetical protein
MKLDRKKINFTKKFKTKKITIKTMMINQNKNKLEGSYKFFIEW